MKTINKSIRVRLLFYIIAASSIITFLFILLLLWTDLQDNLSDADSQVDQMESTVIPALKGSLWKFDESQIRISMESLLSLPNVIHVELNWNETQTGDQKIELGEKESQTYSDNAIRQHDLVIKGNNAEDYYLGELILTTSDENAYNNLYKSAFYITVLQSLKTILISVIILFIIRQVLTRHILDISNQSKKINLSNLKGVFSLNRKTNNIDDELDEVVSALNQMRLRVMQGIEQKLITESALAKEIENSLEKEKLAFAAKQSDQDKSLFLASISHEIRTPMNTIMGFTHLLKKADLKEDDRRHLNYIEKAANSLLLLIDDILDISKLDVGKADVESIPFYFDDVIEMAAATFSHQAKEKNLLLGFTVEKSVPPKVYGDQNRLQQILNNLLSNALKFTHQGSVNVNVTCIDCQNCQIQSVDKGDEKNQAQEQQIQFTVTDTGVGIDPDYIPKIFEVFTQEDASTTRRYGGTGLGMPIVYKLVKLMRGEITVESQVAGVNPNAKTGSRITFTLPFSVCADFESEELQLDEQVATEYKLQGYHILVADDVEMNQALMVSMLQSVGAQVSVAENGKAALEQVKQQQYDLLLMDIQMPEMNGFEVANRIRQLNDEVANIPIIALTANVMHGVKKQCIAAGMNDFLSKPFDPDTLYKKIQSCLSSAAKSSDSTFSNKAAEGQVLPTLDDRVWSGINVAKGMKRWPNNPSEYFPYLLEFLAEIRHSRAQIDKYLENNQLEDLKTLVHKISGSASFLALDCLSTTASLIEKTIFESNQVTGLMLEQYSKALKEVLDNQQKVEKRAKLEES
ncbi:response regulator [Paraglaciecola sp.]|uniref:hybrid sensor histidine kinase/response regulator n=1 Tax=Paraglaciecola sp. TaxID=1920173 RepID=UPI003EFA3145